MLDRQIQRRSIRFSWKNPTPRFATQSLLPVEPVCQYRHGMSYSIPLSHQPRACHRVARIGGLALARGKALYLVSEKVEAGLKWGDRAGMVWLWGMRDLG